jgi:hypothetical protein
LEDDRNRGRRRLGGERRIQARDRDDHIYLTRQKSLNRFGAKAV